MAKRASPAASLAAPLATAPAAADPAVEVLGPGIHYGVAAERYHADPCPTASLSAHLAQILLMRSPYHAWLASPRLNPAFQPDHDPKFAIGNAAHMLLLEGAARFEIIDAPNWKSEAARDERAEVARIGKIALLEHEWQQVDDMVKAARTQLARTRDARFAFRARAGDGEVTVIWAEGPVWCRCRIDWLGARRPRAVFDYKTTDGIARAEAWGQRQLFDIGGDLQAAFNLRALEILGSRGAAFYFVVQETSPPYALSVMTPSPMLLEIAEERRRQAVELWAKCQRRNAWPGYDGRTSSIEPPSWIARDWEAERLQHDIDREAKVDPFRFSIAMWKP